MFCSTAKCLFAKACSLDQEWELFPPQHKAGRHPDQNPKKVSVLWFSLSLCVTQTHANANLLVFSHIRMHVSRDDSVSWSAGQLVH